MTMTRDTFAALAKEVVLHVNEVVAERTTQLEARVVGLEKCVEELQTIVLTMAKARDG